MKARIRLAVDAPKKLCFEGDIRRRRTRRAFKRARRRGRVKRTSGCHREGLLLKEQ